MSLQFSIITPSLNYGKYTRDCIESVLGQGGIMLEHIIIDAGSTDQTHRILNEYSHLKVIIEADQGMSDAINKGFDIAQGQWVMWLNMDDRLKPNALTRVWELSLKRKIADVIHGNCDFIDECGQCTLRYSSLPYNNFIHVHQNHYIPSTATFFRRETVIDQGFRLDCRFRLAMDKEFLARLYKSGKRFYHYPTALAEFRWHDSNLSKKITPEGTMDTQYKIATQSVEAEAIRRVYGLTFTPNSPWSIKFMDCMLYSVASVYKQLLRTARLVLAISLGRNKLIR